MKVVYVEEFKQLTQVVVSLELLLSWQKELEIILHYFNLNVIGSCYNSDVFIVVALVTVQASD